MPPDRFKKPERKATQLSPAPSPTQQLLRNMSVRDEGDDEEFGSNPEQEHSGMIYSSAENHSMLQIAMDSFQTVFQKSFTPDRILETALHVSRSLEAILRHRIEAKLEDEPPEGDVSD